MQEILEVLYRLYPVFVPASDGQCKLTVQQSQQEGVSDNSETGHHVGHAVTSLQPAETTA